MRTQIQFYHVLLNLAWMQTNESHQFLFTGVCGCAKSTEGKGGIIINTAPNGECQFCGRKIGMAPLLALDNKHREWLELYKDEEGHYATRTPWFDVGTETQSPTSAPAIHPSD